MKYKKPAALLAVLIASGLALSAWYLNDGYAGPALPAEASAVHSLANPGQLSYPESAPQLTMIQAQVLPSSPMPVTEALSARVAYDEDVTARVGVGFSGRIVALRVRPGATVKAGDVLAEIDSSDFGTAFADLAKARADEERKRLAQERARDLLPGQAIAPKDWEAAQADYAQAKAETARAQQRLANLNPHNLTIHGQHVSLTSPVSGIVTERTATPGLEVGPGMATPLFVVTDPHRLWLMIDLPEKFVPVVKVGSSVTVDSDAWPSEHFSARIEQQAQTIDPNTRRAVVRATVENPASKLLPEMFVRATVLQDSGSGVRVPNSALVQQGAQSFVFVQTAAGQFQRRQVKLYNHGSEFSFVSTGLQGGERVVTGGALLLDAELAARNGGQS